MSIRSFKYMVLAVPLFLAACGEGYEPQHTTEHFPYGNQRTAGSGVVYVKAKMMPERELKLEPQVEETKKILEEIKEPEPTPEPEAAAEPAPKKDAMEELFDEALKK